MYMLALTGQVYAIIYTHNCLMENLLKWRPANLVRKGMVQGSSKTAPNDRPQGLDLPLGTMPKTDRTLGDKP
jgi:hypothetical protein